MDSYLGSGVKGLRGGKLQGENEAEETGIPLTYPLGHLPTAQEVGQTQSLAYAKQSMASSPLFSTWRQTWGPGGFQLFH